MARGAINASASAISTRDILMLSHRPWTTGTNTDIGQLGWAKYI